MLPTKKRCPRCGRVLPAEAFNLVRGGRELAGWCRVCNHRYYLDRKEAGFVRKNPSGRRIAHGGYTDEVGRYIDLGFLSAVGVRPREDARITDTMNLFTWFMGRRYKLVDAADHIGYEWTGRAHGSLADALATLAVQRWLEQWLVAE